MKRRALISLRVLTAAAAIGWLTPALADQIFVCTIPVPESMEPLPDGFTPQTVTLTAKEDGTGIVTWSNPRPYTYQGVSFPMPDGLLIVAMGKDYAEQYHVSSGSLTIMMASSRSGNELLKAVQSTHGTCRPGP